MEHRPTQSRWSMNSLRDRHWVEMHVFLNIDAEGARYRKSGDAGCDWKTGASQECATGKKTCAVGQDSCAC